MGGGEAQIIDRLRRAKGEKMGVLLCIVHVLMIKRASPPSPCEEQQITVVSVTYCICEAVWSLMIALACYSIQQLRQAGCPSPDGLLSLPTRHFHPF